MTEGRRAHKHSGSRASARPLVVLVALVAGSLLTGLAWVFLVGAAIDFGVLAVNGQGRAWLFTAGASAGAVVCLFLMLALVGRGLRALGFISDYKPRRAGERRRH